MNILVACEESQRVCVAFREKGHRAFSCDVVKCSGGHPEWHIKQDVLPLLNGNCRFKTLDGTEHILSNKWDMIIAFPPCTYLTNVASRHFSLRCTPAEKVVDRWKNRAMGAVFFMRFLLADCDRIAVENPVGFMNSAYRKPDQIIEPYYFAISENDTENYHTKKTCLWLKGLPVLVKTNNLPPPELETFMTASGKLKHTCWEMKVHGSDKRSKTFPGVAKAMSEQWGGVMFCTKQYLMNRLYLMVLITLQTIIV